MECHRVSIIVQSIEKLLYEKKVKIACPFFLASEESINLPYKNWKQHPSIKLKCSSMYDNLVYNIKNYMLSLEKCIFLLYFCHLSAMKSIVVWYGGCWGILCLFFVLDFDSCKSLFCWRQHETMRVPTCKAITLFWRGSIEMETPYLKST